MTKPYRLSDGPVVLSIDIGTSRIKGALVAPSGALLDIPVIRRTTVDAIGLREAVAEVIDEVVDGAPVPVATVAMSSYWHGLVFVDGEGEPLGPISTWQDTSAAAAAEKLSSEDDGEYHTLTGCFLHPSYPMVRISHAETSYTRHLVRWAMSPADWLMLSFFGEAATSPSMASATGLTPVGGETYDDGILDRAAIGAGELPPISTEPLERLRAPWDTRWPSLAAVPWHLPLGDGACGTIGSGCADTTRAALNLGTSGAVRVVTRTPVTPPASLFVYTVVPGELLVGGATSNAGNVAAWAMRELRLPDDAIGEALARPWGSHGLRIDPYLAGERSPRWPPESDGRIDGVLLATTGLDILQGLIEAAAEDLVDVIRTLDGWLGALPDIVASGGLVEDQPAWVRLVSARLGRPLHAPPTFHAPLRGAAALALRSMGVEVPPIPLGEPLS